MLTFDKYILFVCVCVPVRGQRLASAVISQILSTMCLLFLNDFICLFMCMHDG